MGVNDPVLEDKFERLLLKSLGPINSLLETEGITDVYTVADGTVYYEVFGKGTFTLPEKLSVTDRLAIVKGVAACSYRVVGDRDPCISAMIDKYHARIEGHMGRWVRNQPTFAIRKPGNLVPLESWVESGRMTQRQYEYIIEHMVIGHDSFFIVGATGSGKTTVINGVIDAIGRMVPRKRLYIVEDQPEIICTVHNSERVEIEPEEAIEALRSALRYKPKMIIFGEVRRGDVAVQLLESFGTGHPGCATMHANSSREGVTRFMGLLREGLGADPDKARVASSVRYIIHMQALEDRPHDPRYVAGMRGPVLVDIVRIDPFLDERGDFRIREVGGIDEA